MVPLRFNSQLIEFVDEAHQQHLGFARWCDSSKHVVLVFPTMGPQARDISLKPDEKIQFIGTPKPVPRVVTFTFLSSGFEGKRKASTVFKIKGQIGVCQTLQRVKMIDHEPNVLKFIESNGDVFDPMFVTVFGGPPREIPYHVKGDVVTINGGGGEVLKGGVDDSADKILSVLREKKLLPDAS